MMERKTWTTPSLRTLNIQASTNLNYPPGAADNTAASDSSARTVATPFRVAAFCIS